MSSWVRLLRLLPVACLALLAMGASARFDSWAPLASYELTALREGSAFRVTLPSAARPVEVEFQPVSVLARGYGAEEMDEHGRRRGVHAPRVHTFHGSVLANAGRDFAKLSYRPGRAHIQGLMRIDDVLYDLDADLARGDLVLRVREITREELGELLQSCGVTASDAALLGTGISGSAPNTAAAGSLREVELGTEADALFVSQVGDAPSANARILSIVNAVNGIYEVDLGLTNRVVVQRAWTGGDPYTSSDSGTLLGQFRTSFSQNVSAVYDDAQLFSGRDFESSVVGRAWLSSTCSSYRFGVNQYFQRSDSLVRLIMAHELGHNLGANHASDGGIMSPSVNSSVTWFSPTSKSEIASYVSRVACLAEVAASAGPPTLTPIGPQLVAEQQLLRIQMSGTDPDGGALSYGATPLPPGATLSIGGLFEYLPPRDTAGCSRYRDVSVRFSVTDAEGLQAGETVPISVTDVPLAAAPLLADPADRSIRVGLTLSLQLSASDADGDSVSFSAPSLPTGAALSAAGLLSWTPDSTQLGVHSLTFVASDCTGLASASQSVALTVQAKGKPKLRTTSPRTAASGRLVVIEGSDLAGNLVEVRFGAKRAALVAVSDDALRVRVPKLAQGRVVRIRVVRDGEASENALRFRVSG